jgi:hypothetical protein
MAGVGDPVVFSVVKPEVLYTKSAQLVLVNKFLSMYNSIYMFQLLTKAIIRL